ncbi:MAG: hypothetical protein HYY24_28995 [Verrucomicrobia bacterium]|nr:hypothetical protein [Verrucomicrobiota bacterium]
MSKPFKHDPQWVKAKQLCRLNQEDIAKAKALGLSPKTLMKNIPSPQQQWKQPVKQWIRELHEKRFGAKKEKPGKPRHASDRPPKAAHEELPADEDYTEFDADGNAGRTGDEELSEEDFGLPTIDLERVPEFYYADDPEWHTHRLDRRQVNLRWAAAALALALKEVAAVEAISLIGSVAAPQFEPPNGQLWEEPPKRTRCRDLDLAVWVTRCDDEVLQALAAAVTETLRSLREEELIQLDWAQLDLYLFEARSDQLLGRLRPSRPEANPADPARTAPWLDVDPSFEVRPADLQWPRAVGLYERQPPPSEGFDGDVEVPF